MHTIIDKKFYLGPKFGTLFIKKWITNSELLHGLIPNLQLTSITTQHKRPQCQNFKARKVKCAIRFVRALLTNFRKTLVRV
jgi:hypothetical protein